MFSPESVVAHIHCFFFSLLQQELTFLPDVQCGCVTDIIGALCFSFLRLSFDVLFI